MPQPGTGAWNFGQIGWLVWVSTQADDAGESLVEGTVTVHA